MSRDIIRDNEGYPITVRSFYGGVLHGPCVQVSVERLGIMDGEKGWGSLVGVATMTRNQAIKFFETALERLQQQVKEDLDRYNEEERSKRYNKG